jgi:hypothetical protein
MPPYLQTTFGVFSGTLPLVGTIFWAAFQQNARFDAITQRFESVDKRLGRIESQIDTLIKQGAEHNTRIAVIETKLGGEKLVQVPR